MLIAFGRPRCLQRDRVASQRKALQAARKREAKRKASLVNSTQAIAPARAMIAEPFVIPEDAHRARLADLINACNQLGPDTSAQRATSSSIANVSGAAGLQRSVHVSSGSSRNVSAPIVHAATIVATPVESALGKTEPTMPSASAAFDAPLLDSARLNTAKVPVAEARASLIAFTDSAAQVVIAAEAAIAARGKAEAQHDLTQEAIKPNRNILKRTQSWRQSQSA